MSFCPIKALDELPTPWPRCQELPGGVAQLGAYAYAFFPVLSVESFVFCHSNYSVTNPTVVPAGNLKTDKTVDFSKGLGFDTCFRSDWTPFGTFSKAQRTSGYNRSWVRGKKFPRRPWHVTASALPIRNSDDFLTMKSLPEEQKDCSSSHDDEF